MYTRKPRLFLAEDDPVGQTILLNQLQHLPIDVSLAQNGLEVLQACEAGLPDLIVLDIEMPVMDGIETIRQLRAKYGDQLPVIALTGHEHFPYRDYGFQKALTKPVQAQKLIHTIQTYFDFENMVEEQYHYQKLLEVCNGDTKFARKMLDLFVHQTEIDLTDLKKLSTEVDKEKIRMILHRMKSTLGYMGLAEIRQEAIRLELVSKNQAPEPSEIGHFVGMLSEKMPLFQKVRAML